MFKDKLISNIKKDNNNLLSHPTLPILNARLVRAHFLNTQFIQSMMQAKKSLDRIQQGKSKQQKEPKLDNRFNEME